MASKDFLEKLGVPVLTVCTSGILSPLTTRCLNYLEVCLFQVIQQEREIIVTYPFALHSGFKMGWNIQEAANFADEWWVEPALLTPICDCL